MSQLSKKDVKELISMRDMSVKEFIEKIKQHPTLSMLLTTAGIWMLLRFLFVFIVSANVIYAVFRIFSLVLG